MHVGGDEQRVASLVRNDANTSDQVADGPDGIAPIGRAEVVFGLTAEPGKIAFLARFLFEGEVVLGGSGLLLLLDGRCRLLALLLRGGSQGGGTGAREENVDVIGK